MADGGFRVERVERERWISLCGRFADHNYRQSWDFGIHAAARVGAVSEHVAILDGERVAALADVRIRHLPLIGGGIAYVNGGPLTRTDASWDVTRYAAAVEALRRAYADERGMLLRFVAPIGPAEWNRDVAAAFERSGFTPTTAARPYRTMLVDVTRPLAEVRKVLRQKWRNCLNRAEREQITVTSGRDGAAFDRFASLFEEFVVRRGFEISLPASFYAAVQRDLPDGERFQVLLAERGGSLIAGHVSSTLGDTTVYLLGATAPEALTCKAAYLLQWRAIESAQETKCRWYDLGGIDPDANPGVFHFKDGLGGEDVLAAGPLEWCRGPRARLAQSLERRYRASQEARAARDATSAAT